MLILSRAKICRCYHSHSANNVRINTNNNSIQDTVPQDPHIKESSDEGSCTMEDDRKQALLQELFPNYNEKLHDLLVVQSNACY